MSLAKPNDNEYTTTTTKPFSPKQVGVGPNDNEYILEKILH
jgi:hypothetical protein